MQRVAFHAMGCEMLAIVQSDEPAARSALGLVPTWFEAWEQALSRFRAHSELSRLNARVGQWIPVSDTLWDVTQAAIESAHSTQGLVTPLALRALEAAGYDRSFELIRSGMAGDAAVAARVPDWRELDWDGRTRELRVPSDAGLDLGGTAKGWAADQAARRLARHGPVLMDAGGDIAVSGPQAGGEPWPIAVETPGESEAPSQALVLLSAGGVATSGRDYRRWLRDGQPQHHVIDPRTGRPAETDVLTATVVAPSTREAEAAAKAVLILGHAAGLEWIDARPWLAGLVIRENGAMLESKRMRDYLWESK